MAAWCGGAGNIPFLQGITVWGEWNSPKDGVKGAFALCLTPNPAVSWMGPCHEGTKHIVVSEFLSSDSLGEFR